MSLILSGDKLASVYQPSTTLNEYNKLVDNILSLAIASGLGPNKPVTLTVTHKGRRDHPQNKVLYHELVVSALPPTYYKRGLMWMGMLPGDKHYRLVHVCATDPPADPQWVFIDEASYVYDPLCWVDSLESMGGSIGGSGASPSTSIITLEALTMGDFVNVATGTSGVCKAVASDPDKEATGYVKASYDVGVSATVYFSGINDKVTGITPGPVFLSTTPGQVTSDPSSLVTGQLRQRVGTALSATSINFQPDISIIL